MKALHKRLDQLHLDTLPFPNNVFFRAYKSGMITHDEYTWISNSNIPFAPVMWMEYETIPEADKYKRILDKTGYLPPVEWMD